MTIFKATAVSFLLIFLIASWSIVSASSGNSESDNSQNLTIVETANITDRGEWGDLATCSNVSENFVVGFQLRVDYRDPLNEDNTGLNGVWLACGKPKTSDKETDQPEISEWITSANASYGEFQRRLFCSNDGNNSGYAIGFQLKYQLDQEVPAVDDVGAVNLRMICADGEVIEGYDEKENENQDAEYKQPLICSNGMAVCGIQTQVEALTWTGDNLALNNIRIQCCPFSQNNL